MKKVVIFIFLYIFVMQFSYSEGTDNSNDSVNVFDIVKQGDLIGLGKYISNGGNINLQDENGLTPLMYSVYYHNTDILVLLLKNEANISIRSKTNYTALEIAVEENYPDAVELIKKYHRQNKFKFPII